MKEHFCDGQSEDYKIIYQEQWEDISQTKWIGIWFVSDVGAGDHVIPIIYCPYCGKDLRISKNK